MKYFLYCVTFRLKFTNAKSSFKPGLQKEKKNILLKLAQTKQNKYYRKRNSYN